MNPDERDELEEAIEQLRRDDPEFDKVYREIEAQFSAAEAKYLAEEIRKNKYNPLRFLARTTGLGCWCCGQWRRCAIHWYSWQAPFGGPTWCIECKFDICPLTKCNADLLNSAGDA